MTLKKAFKFILNCFEGNYEQALIWFCRKHHNLGDQAPVTMISQGRTNKLCDYIEAIKEGYYP